MQSAAALRLELAPSRWQQRLRCLLSLLVAVALGFSLTNWSAALLSVLCLIALCPWRKDGAHTLMLSDDACQIDARSSNGSNDADSVAPALQSIWQWLGLIWIQNSAQQTLLIWPDQLSVDQHRRLRQSLKRMQRTGVQR